MYTLSLLLLRFVPLSSRMTTNPSVLKKIIITMLQKQGSQWVESEMKTFCLGIQIHLANDGFRSGFD